MRRIVLILMVLLLSGCLPSSEDQLVFVERLFDSEGDEAQQQANLAPVVKDQVQLQESNLPRVAVCVLPFANLSGNEDFNYIRTALLEQFRLTLMDFSRFEDAVILTENEYTSLIEQIGYEGPQAPDREIAAYLRSTRDVEYIVYGEIEVNEAEGRLLIRPAIIDVGEFGVETHDAGSYSLLFTEIFNLGPIVQAVINNIDQLAEA